MSVLRWVITDPYDTNVLTNTYTFPRNPSDMTSPYRDRAVQSMSTTTGVFLLTEGGGTAKQWQFSGPILHKQQLDDLLAWVYNRHHRLNIRDHYGRNIACVLLGLDVVPKRRNGYYYSHDYTISALVSGISAPNIGDGGPA